ncbi:TPA: hypothetical protein DCG29_04045 [Candidatus Nomurabacteria bacterium]|nr:hypothetical protein [Candidatus Nomurabacteria bacterium]
MKFSLEKSHGFGWEGLKGFAYNSKKEFPNASTAYFEVSGSHGKTKTTLSDRIYYVIEGNGEFTVGDQKITVAKSDVVIIPKNTAYDYKTSGKVLKLFLVHTPAYDPQYEVSC